MSTHQRQPVHPAPKAPAPKGVDRRERQRTALNETRSPIAGVAEKPSSTFGGEGTGPQTEERRPSLSTDAEGQQAPWRREGAVLRDRGVELGLIVDDDTPELQLGQMRKSEFMALAGSAIYATAEEGLAGTGQSARDCTYIRFWLAVYHGRDARTVERAVLRFAPEARGAMAAAGLVLPLSTRVRKAVDVWARTGRITGVPYAGLFSSSDESSGVFPVPMAGDPSAAEVLQQAGGDLEQGAGLQLQIGPGRPLEGDVALEWRRCSAPTSPRCVFTLDRLPSGWPIVSRLAL